MKVLIVALGRMGQRYRDVLEELYADNLEIFTVDPNVSSDSPAHHGSLNNIPSDIKFDLAVDARPNLGRLELLKEFTKREIPSIIIEKPMAASFEESKGMLDHISSLSYQPKILIPFYRRYMKEFSKATIDKANLGPLRSMTVGGGACGIGCNGIHLIDLANFLFDEKPKSVYAELELDSIESPRGENFNDFSGTMLVQYLNGKLTLEVLPNSSVGTGINLYFERGKIIIPDQIRSDWLWFKEPEESRDKPFYLTFRDEPTEAPLPFNLNLIDLMKTGIKAFLNNESSPNIHDGYNALKCIALAIASDSEKRPVFWDEDDLLNEMKFTFT